MPEGEISPGQPKTQSVKVKEIAGKAVKVGAMAAAITAGADYAARPNVEQAVSNPANGVSRTVESLGIKTSKDVLKDIGAGFNPVVVEASGGTPTPTPTPSPTQESELDQLQTQVAQLQATATAKAKVSELNAKVNALKTVVAQPDNPTTAGQQAELTTVTPTPVPISTPDVSKTQTAVQESIEQGISGTQTATAQEGKKVNEFVQATRTAETQANRTQANQTAVALATVLGAQEITDQSQIEEKVLTQVAQKVGTPTPESQLTPTTSQTTSERPSTSETPQPSSGNTSAPTPESPLAATARILTTTLRNFWLEALVLIGVVDVIQSRTLQPHRSVTGRVFGGLFRLTRLNTVPVPGRVRARVIRIRDWLQAHHIF